MLTSPTQGWGRPVGRGGGTQLRGALLPARPGQEETHVDSILG